MASKRYGRRSNSPGGTTTGAEPAPVRTRKLLRALMQEIIELRARVRVLEGRLRNLKIASVSSAPRRPGQGSRVVLLKSERPPEDAA